MGDSGGPIFIANGEFNYFFGIHRGYYKKKMLNQGNLITFCGY